MFVKSARWYDALYKFKDCAKESAVIVSLFKQEHPAAMTVLNVACGTGENDRHLAKKYRVDGLDINEEFILAATVKYSAGEYFCADMTDFDLGRRYDVVLCLFSSIGYTRTIENVFHALRCFEKHLNTDGIIVGELWFTQEAWTTDGKVYMLTGETVESKICRMNINTQKGLISVIDLHYLVGTASGIEYFTGRHELGLFSMEEMMKVFAAAKLVVKYNDTGLAGRGLYIARKGNSQQNYIADAENAAVED